MIGSPEHKSCRSASTSATTASRCCRSRPSADELEVTAAAQLRRSNPAPEAARGADPQVRLAAAGRPDPPDAPPAPVPRPPHRRRAPARVVHNEEPPPPPDARRRVPPSSGSRPATSSRSTPTTPASTTSPPARSARADEVRQEVILMAARNDDVNDVVEHLHRPARSSSRSTSRPAHLPQPRTLHPPKGGRERRQRAGRRRRPPQPGRHRPRTRDQLHQADRHRRASHFHDAVSRKLGITPEEAEALRRRLVEAGEPADAAARRDPVRQAVFDATREPMEERPRDLALPPLLLGHVPRPPPDQAPPGRRRGLRPPTQSLLNSALVIPVEIGRPLYSVNTSKIPSGNRRGSMSASDAGPWAGVA